MQVRLFGMFAEALGVETVTVNSSGTVADLRKNLLDLHPVFHQVPFRIAVDQRIALESEHVNEDQELAALPPFSGG
jgi:molybdopterin converting factor small subunit